jgi:hypothetical protein
LGTRKSRQVRDGRRCDRDGGSADQDTQSWNNSREIVVVVDDPVVTSAWDGQFFQSEFDAGAQVEQCPL